mgnify:CR=1 FL=1
MNYDDRKRRLKQELKRGRKIVLYVVENIESAQFRYRCKNVVGVMDKSEYAVVWFLKSEIEEVDFAGVSLVVIERQTDKNGSIVKLIDRMSMADIKVKVLFDLDDLVFDYRDLPLLMRTTNSKNVFYWAGYFWGIRRIAKRADGFLCTNDFLGKKLKRSFGKPYQVIPNSLNKAQLEVSDEAIRKKHSEIRKEFVVGYFSGSPTHTKDFRLIEPELVEFLSRHDDAVLRIVGDIELSRKMRVLCESGRVKIMKKVDYLKLQKLISEVDVNIAPLVINDFTNCKSELKFFEAAAVETTTIASPTYTFKKAIEDGENGFLAQPGEWYDKLEYLYSHPDENKRIAKRAREYALKHYYGKEFLKEVEVAYDYFAK